MKQLFILILFNLIFSLVYSQEPDPDFSEKHALLESVNFVKSISVAEDESYADYDLTFQRMNWQVNPAVNYIKGSITSYFLPKKENFSSITFDLTNQLQVDSISYHGNLISFQHDNDKIRIQFPGMIPISGADSLTIWYQGSPPSPGFGSFVSTTTEQGNPILWTLSEPYGAMDWWPCKQSLVDKIDSIEVHVTCPVGNKVASNGKLISEKTDGGNKTVVWKHKYPIVTYLVAIAVTNYSAYSDFVDLDDGRQIEILNYVYPEYLVEAQTRSADTKDMMELFNSLIGEYPFADEKYGHAQFDWSGGMEHQTMSFMRNLNFELTAHEMAHQWFGDYITLGSWQDIWLNEGFATYFTGLAYENLLDGIYWDRWKRLQLEKITSSASGSVFVNDTTNVLRIFSGRLSYSKGAYLLHMLRWELGDDAFFEAIRNYYNDPNVANGFTTNEELIYHLEQTGDTTLTEFFNDWYYGEGYPVYQISHYTDMGDNGKYKISISQTTSDPSVGFFEMHVPLRVWKNGVSKDLRFQHTIKTQTFEIDEKPDSIQFDPGKWLISKNSVVTEVVELSTKKFLIYPNPTEDKLNIQLNSNEKIQSIEITDINGRTVKQINSQFSVLIDISGLPSGIYLIRVKTDKNHYKRSFVKHV